MTTLKEMVSYLDGLIGIASVPKDSSNNGLQVQGKKEIAKVIFAVDACLSLFDKAILKKADFIFIHHGLSWGDNLKRLVGPNATRLSPLFKNDISVYAAHLPLDMHPEIGHNAVIAAKLKLGKCRMFAKYADAEIGVVGELPTKSTSAQIAKILDSYLDAKCIIYGDKNCEIRKVGIISGGAGPDGINEAARQGIDCFITGEVGHSSYHFIRESNLKVIAAGHYASEKPGVLAVMAKVKSKFQVDCEFIDLPTGL